jgi:hypothetical protein
MNVWLFRFVDWLHNTDASRNYHDRSIIYSALIRLVLFIELLLVQYLRL